MDLSLIHILVPASTTVEEILNLAKEEGFSRIPVYEKDFDDIIGVAYVKDLIDSALHGGKDEPIVKTLRKPIYVPETKLCSKLLREFQEEKVHMAIVIDEYLSLIHILADKSDIVGKILIHWSSLLVNYLEGNFQVFFLLFQI